MSSENARIEHLNNYIHELEQRIEHLQDYIHDLETAAATDREELLKANRIIEVRDNNLNNIAASLHHCGVDFIQGEINDMKEQVAWIGEYKEKFNQLGTLLELKENVDDDGNTHYRPDDIIYAVAELEILVQANESQTSSSKMSSEMFKL